MKFFEIILIILFGIFVLTLSINYFLNLMKSEEKEKIFYRKEDFLNSLNIVISNCLKINETKKVLCFLAEYRGREEFELPEIKDVIRDVEKIYPNQKIAFFYLPENKVLITNYDIVK